MLNTPPPNLLADFWSDLHDVKWLWQAAAAASSLLLAWLVSKGLRPRIASMENSPAVGRDALAAIQFPIIALLLIVCIRAIMGSGSTLLDLMLALLTAAIIIRLAVVMLRQVFAPSGWRESLIRYIAVAVWIGFALYISGLLPDLLKFLDGLEFSIGKQRISLLLVLQALLWVLATVLTALWLGRFIEARAMAATDVDINLRVIISKLAQALLVLFAILVALPAVGVDLTALSVFGGALGVGLGIGLQKIASNYISGFIILMDRSVSLGDVVTIDGHTGQLSKMTARYVVVRSPTDVEANIPNDTLITSTVINRSYADKRVRQVVLVRVDYDSDLEHAMRLMEEAAARQPRILADPVPKAVLVRFGESGVELELGFWVDDPHTSTITLRSDLQLDIWSAFRLHQIAIPYPQRTASFAGAPTEGLNKAISS